jgi:hypothetical protein
MTMKRSGSERNGRTLAGGAPPGGVQRRSFLRGGLAVGAAATGLAIASSSAAFPQVARAAATPSPQPGWYWCNRCAMLFHSDDASSSGWCPYYAFTDGSQPGPHRVGSLTEYCLNNNQSVSSDQQSDWAWCSDCQGLFYLPDIETSGCAGAWEAGRVNDAGYYAHRDGGSTNYEVYWVADASGLQSGWNYCTSCRSLFHGSGRSVGACLNAPYEGHTPGPTPYWVTEMTGT